MKLSTARRLSVAVMGVCLFSLTAATAGAADKKEVVQQARNSYYSLKTQGLVDFHCSLTPNWDALLADTKKQDPQAADKAIATLKQLQFTVSLGTTGSAKVTHTTLTPDNAEMAKGLNQIYGGMEQMVSGFFDTWSPFMISSPFPDADGVYDLADQGDVWNLSYKEGENTDVVNIMGKNLVIRELKVTTPQFSSSIRPQFTRSAQGLLLTGYDADYRGQSASETTQLKVGISYQMVNGLQLPQKLNLSGSYGGTPFQVEVAFSGCQATKQ